MKSLVILGCMAALTIAQRPFYAGISQKIYPELASRFKDTEESNSDSSSTTSTTSSSIVNRIGEGAPQTAVKIPTYALGDTEFVTWLNTWIRENRPHWLLNTEHVDTFRDSEGIRRKQQEQISSRYSFDDY